MADLPVIIVGGGIGGLAAALALARTGVRSEVIEQAAEFKEIGAGIQLGPNVFKMLERLSLRDEIDRYAVFPDALVMMDSLSGDLVTRVPIGEAFVKRFNHPYALIHRGDLHGIFLRACKANGLVGLHPGRTIVRYEDRGGEVTAFAEEGENFRGRALIGADGLWSMIRQNILADGPPRVSGHIAYRAVLPIEQIEPHYRTNEMVLWGGPKNHLVHYPLRGGELYNLVAVFHSSRYEEGWNTFGDSEELHRRFEGTCRTVQDLLAKIQEWRMWVLCDREPAKDWSKGRVTLLGDAAHPMLQYLAQGAGMAIEDGVVLADALQAAGGDVVTAFERYRDARYLRTGRCQITARIYGEFFHAEGVARELRYQVLHDRPAQKAYEGLAWLYDGI
jgi:2-polyprenyl-6-methoxyphenol hydroxylase-like FAD-dependent oxidoreductase